MKTYIVFLVVLFTSITIQAQNNERKGFILGLGVGPSLHSIVDSERDDKVVFSTNFKIGYAPTNQLALYWNSQVDWFKEFDVQFANAVGGLGGTYYLEEEAPSIYINALLGFSNLRALEDSENNIGIGWGLGGGYEFARHWGAEVNFSYGKPSNDYEEIKTWSARFIISYLMY